MLNKNTLIMVAVVIASLYLYDNVVQPALAKK